MYEIYSNFWFPSLLMDERYPSTIARPQEYTIFFLSVLYFPWNLSWFGTSDGMEYRSNAGTGVKTLRQTHIPENQKKKLKSREGKNQINTKGIKSIEHNHLYILHGLKRRRIKTISSKKKSIKTPKTETHLHRNQQSQSWLCRMVGWCFSFTFRWSVLYFCFLLLSSLVSFQFGFSLFHWHFLNVCLVYLLILQVLSIRYCHAIH